MPTTTTHATIPTSRYDADARADAVSRGLAPTTLGELYGFQGTLLLAIVGARTDAERWADYIGATLVLPPEPAEHERAGYCGPTLHTDLSRTTHTSPHDAGSDSETAPESAHHEDTMDRQNDTTTPESQARTLVLDALESYGSNALQSAERARALVGIDGIESIADTLESEGARADAHRIRGALDALRGSGFGVYLSGEYNAGFDTVDAGGFAGLWDEPAEQPSPPAEPEPETAESQARALVLDALESYGSNAIETAERARALVGVRGIESIARALDIAGEPEQSARVLGALDALLDAPERTMDRYAGEYFDALDSVDGAGFGGRWSE